MQVETGNPSAKPASFTRFVLPFAYSDYNFGNHWKELSEDEKKEKDFEIRKSYFTAETSQVLFNQASYFKFKESDLSLNYKEIILTVSPQIVLFENKSAQKDSILKTGFLIIELYFDENQEIPFETLLEVNELFRYKKRPYDGHENKLSKEFCDQLRKSNGLPEIAEKFEDKDYGHWEILLRSFIGEKFSPMKDWIENDNSGGKKLCWDIYTDSRTFVWTCAVIKKGVEAFPDAAEPYNHSYWIKLLNVDCPDKKDEIHDSVETAEATAFEKEWVKDKSYTRWLESGSLYGFSYHSGVAVVPSHALDNNQTELPLHKHFGQIYFDMTLLLFYVRVTLFRFSNKLTEISIKARNNSDSEKVTDEWSKAFKNLRWEFTLFTNLYRFPLISNQQQGIEMFDIAKRALDIDEFYEEIQQEIHNSQEFMEQMISKIQSESSLNLSKKSTVISENSLKLTRIATGGLVIGMALTMLGTELSKSMGSIIKNNIPDAVRTENGLSVDWFLILLYIPIFWLLLTAIVKGWEKFFGDKK